MSDLASMEAKLADLDTEISATQTIRNKLYDELTKARRQVAKRKREQKDYVVIAFEHDPEDDNPDITHYKRTTHAEAVATTERLRGIKRADSRSTVTQILDLEEGMSHGSTPEWLVFP